MSKWDDLVNRAVAQRGFSVRLVRLADPNVPGSVDVEVQIDIANAQYREREHLSGGDVTQQSRYFMIPAQKLRATAFPGAPRPGDRIIVNVDIEEILTIRNVGPGFADGRVVRWDVEVIGI